jgi:hypothetical protein
MGVDAFEIERDHTASGLGLRPVEIHVLHLPHLLQGIAHQGMFVRLYLLHTQLLEVFHSNTETYPLGNRGRSRLKFPRQVVPARALKGHFADHVAATEERFHLFQDVPFAIQPADAGRAEHLVARKGKKIAIEGAHVDRHMWDTLRPIHTYQGALIMRHFGQRVYGVDGSQYI